MSTEPFTSLLKSDLLHRVSVSVTMQNYNVQNNSIQRVDNKTQNEPTLLMVDFQNNIKRTNNKFTTDFIPL